LEAHEYDASEVLEHTELGERQCDGYVLSTEAAATGDLALLKWLDMHSFNCFQLYEDELMPRFTEVAEHVHLHVLQWLHEQDDIQLDMHDLTEGAAAGGHLPILQWLDEVVQSWAVRHGGSCALAAVEYGHVHLLEWLAEQGVQVVVPPIARHAAAHGELNVLQWLQEEVDLARNDEVCKAAAGAGHLAVLQWLRLLGCLSCPFDAAQCTAEVNKSIQRLRRPDLNLSTARHEEMLDWLREVGGE
jgi:diadenosine tetraphosphatase ApaH/serine/threonine PP2A family protein phosphatase